MVEVGKKYKVSNLYKIRKFYEVFSEEKDNTRMVSMTLDEYNNYLIWKTQQEINQICKEGEIKL